MKFFILKLKYDHRYIIFQTNFIFISTSAILLISCFILTWKYDEDFLFCYFLLDLCTKSSIFIFICLLADLFWSFTVL